jgi:hypothetical protein
MYANLRIPELRTIVLVSIKASKPRNFRSEHIENAEASRARAARLLVHDINSELHPLTIDVQDYDRSAFWDVIKVVRECSP